ncbi:GNAT family N-acetyltransferase [Luteimonas aquatica]|uniref:GNAT family N-acetyltransferase n=1 Tax=Luteimonas aquatica TaxID=450364 RepID=UPI001F57E560|nr:GNAT family protein [Luteimonas aquatica]
MLIEAKARDFAALLDARAPRQNLRLVPDCAIAPPDVLRMLGDLAADIRRHFAPSAWMIVENGEVVGLCSVIRPPLAGELHIGYGIAPRRQGAGVATRAVASLADWARGDPRVARITAETSVGNIGSQQVLARNGFRRTGERMDAEDGPLFCWELHTAE